MALHMHSKFLQILSLLEDLNHNGKLTFLFPEAAILLFSTKNRNLWAGPGQEILIHSLPIKSDKSD